MNIEIEIFSPRSTAAAVNAERRHLTRVPDAEDQEEAAARTQTGTALPGWRFIVASDPAFVAAAGLWIDGQPMAPGIPMRLRMARNSVIGASYAPVLVVITPIADWRNVEPRQRNALQQRIATLLQTHAIDDQVRAMGRGAR